MKTTEDILAQFDDIRDLPVSEEMIGAYLEGNLSADEMNDVDILMAGDDSFAGFVSSISATDPYDINLGDFDTVDDSYIDLGHSVAPDDIALYDHDTFYDDYNSTSPYAESYDDSTIGYGDIPDHDIDFTTGMTDDIDDSFITGL